MCVIASAENNAQQHEWFDKKFVDTTNLQIPPEVYAQYRTLVYTMDQGAHEWELRASEGSSLERRLIPKDVHRHERKNS